MAVQERAGEGHLSESVVQSLGLVAARLVDRLQQGWVRLYLPPLSPALTGTAPSCLFPSPLSLPSLTGTAPSCPPPSPLSLPSLALRPVVSLLSLSPHSLALHHAAPPLPSLPSLTGTASSCPPP